MTIKIHPQLTGFVRPSDHSKFSPSAADRWMACAASIKLSEGIAEEKNEYSDQGTLAHSVCEAMFDHEHFMIDMPLELQMKLMAWESTHPGDVPEMYDCAQTYVDCVSSWLKDTDRIGDVLWYGLEKGVPVFPEKGCFGTGDCVIVGTKAAVIIDYKHGRGKNVQADALQLRVYAAGVLRHLDDLPEGYGVFSVVVQPRTDPSPKTHFYPAGQIHQFLGDIWNAIIATEQPNLEPKDGGHCFWCPAKRTKDLMKKCPTQMILPVNAAKENFEKYLADMNAPVENLGVANPKRDEAMMKIISLMPLLESIRDSAVEEFQYRMEQGEAIPGLQMVEKVGNRTFNKAEDTEIASLLTSRYPKLNPWRVIPEKKTIRTISDIEKEVGKGALDSVTVRKVKKEVRILDAKALEVMGNLAHYGNLSTSKEIV